MSRPLRAMSVANVGHSGHVIAVVRADVDAREVRRERWPSDRGRACGGRVVSRPLPTLFVANDGHGSAVLRAEADES